MIQNVIPAQLKYQRIVPRGFPSVFKQWTIDPMSSNRTWVTNDIVRFMFQNLSKGVFDPYRSYIQVTVSCNQNSNPIGLLQIDNSAQSFFQQMIVYSQNRQVQRITQYGVIAAYLNDIGMSQIISQGRQPQGLGFGSFDTMPFGKAHNFSNVSRKHTNSHASDNQFTWGPGTIFPTIYNTWGYNTDNSKPQLFLTARACKGHNSSSNTLMSGLDHNGGNWYPGTPCWQFQYKINGCYNNMRTQYYTNFIKNNYIQSTSAVPCYQLCLQPSVFHQGGYNSTDTPISIPRNVHGNIVYSTTYNLKVRDVLNFNDDKSDPNQHTINTANYGFSSLFSPAFSRGTFQPFISATIPQCMMLDGKFLPTKKPVKLRKFKVPVLSGIVGILIQLSQFMLIPLQSVAGLLMQFTLDPYAMFTSGYKDICEMDDAGMNYQQQRNYIIQRFQYKLHTYHFISQQMNMYIKNSLYKQINFVSNFWSLGNQFQVPGGQGPNNTYIVGCNSQYLNQLVCLFVSNDYQSYTFCRKHYRLSNCITKYSCKMGVQYWPPQPYKGNAGNISSDFYDDDNSIFVENIYWSNNYMFSNTTPLPRINVYNFAINQRPYDPTNRSTFYHTDMKGNHNYTFVQGSVNADTALGMPWIHQNRCVGKAAFPISFSPNIQQQNILRGIDVSKLSNFQVIFQSNTPKAYTRDQTLYIFCRSSVIVKLTKQGVFTYGR